MLVQRIPCCSILRNFQSHLPLGIFITNVVHLLTDTKRRERGRKFEHKRGEELEGNDAIKNENNHTNKKPKEYQVIKNDDENKIKYDH